MKKSILLCLLLILLCAPGCMSKNEIEKLAIVMSMGVDHTPSGQYLISTQILKAQKASPAGGSKSQQSSSDVMIASSHGDTISDALAHLSTQMGKKIILSHVKSIIIGEDTAKIGMGDLVNLVDREYDLRPSIIFLIAKGKAVDILTTTTPEDPVPADSIESILKLQATYGYVPVISSLEFSNALASKTASPIAGVISLHQNEGTGVIFQLMDTAVFTKDKLIGYMNEKETRGMQWILGKVKRGTILIPSPETGTITLDIITAKSQIKPIMRNNKPLIQVTITKTGNIKELSGTLDIMKNPELLNDLAERQDNVIKDEAQAAIYMAQHIFNADIFDFGEAIHKDYPDEWKELQDHWTENFPTLPVEIYVHSSIQRIGAISKPIY